ncbi:MAG: thermonuclease family protein [Hyphomicrobium sp.]
MFGWRKRSEGFEWQEYVRTTILVRRADRQKRLDDARVAAIEKVQHVKDSAIEAGKAGLDQAAAKAERAARSTGRSAVDAMLALFSVVGAFLKSGYGVAVKIITPYLPQPSEPAERTGRPIHERFADKRAQYAQLRRKRDVEDLEPDVGSTEPAGDGHPAFGYALHAAAALCLVLVFGALLQGGESLETGSVSRPTAIVAEPLELDGRATAISGDALRLNGQIVRLAGVAAPEDNQPCFTAKGRRWSCSAFARKALERIVRGKRVACTPSGADDSGVTRASCQIDGEDIARALIRGGHVFAESGLFAAYRAEEDAAREAQAGVWQGETVRPEDWRTRIWEEAKRTAPDGCPIKGVMRAGEGVYAMPWSSDYAVGRVGTAKGDRWFCSEQEARDAGFKPSLRS